jgi:phage terminase large subunit
MKIIIPYKPQPRQQLFHKCKADEILYGGAAGGGKSEALLHDALKNAMKYSQCKIIMFRRTFPELERSLILRSREVYPAKLGKYNESKKRWTFINGSIIEFAYLDKESDVYNYQGAEYDFIYFDELTHFTETQYTYLLSRLRGTAPIHRQVKSASNPGGVGHVWVRARFIDPSPPETVFEGEDGRTRCFIPAKVWDNRALLDADPGYIQRLESLDEQTRRQLLDGDWDVFAGQMFREFDRTVHVIEPFSIPDHWIRIRSIDEGYNDPFVCQWWAFDERGKAYLYREFKKRHLLSSQQAEMVREMSGVEKYRYNVGDTSMWAKSKDTGVSPAEIFLRHGIPLVQATKERVNGWKRLREYMHVYETVDPVSGQMVKDTDLYVFSTCTNFISTVPSLICDEHEPEDIADGQDDHCLVAGTMVETEVGLVPIERIRPGDKVLTRKGFQTVLAAGVTNMSAITKTVTFSDGTELTGTANHPVWIIGKGFVPLGHLKPGDCVEVSPNWSRLKYIMGEDTDAIQTPLAYQMRHTLSGLSRVGISLNICTAVFGKTIMALFLKVITFITRMVIRPIITSTILNVCQPKSIFLTICNNGNLTSNFLNSSDHLLLNGIVQKKEKDGIAKMENFLGKRGSMSQSDAITVRSRTKQSLIMSDSVPTPVNPHGGEKRGLITRFAHVLFATTRLLRTNTRKSKHAQRHARFICGVKTNTEPKTVYNLTVDMVPEYYANGVLVHNCADAARYALMSRPPKTRPLPKPPATGEAIRWERAEKSAEMHLKKYAKSSKRMGYR